MPNHDHSPFGETEGLREIFAEAKKRRPTRSPAHVLVVEDDALTRRIVSGAFKETFVMLSAGDARDAVADYLMRAPDVVFLDIGLPDMDGFAVLDEIMAADRDAFVVMFSANLHPENVRKAKAAGAKGFIPKPFNREQIHHFIHCGISHHQSEGI